MIIRFKLKTDLIDLNYQLNQLKIHLPNQRNLFDYFD